MVKHKAMAALPPSQQININEEFCYMEDYKRKKKKKKKILLLMIASICGIINFRGI